MCVRNVSCRVLFYFVCHAMLAVQSSAYYCCAIYDAYDALRCHNEQRTKQRIELILYIDRYDARMMMMSRCVLATLVDIVNNNEIAANIT